jgi:hypothetical protein
MLYERTIPKERSSDPALNQEKLYAIGLEYVRELSSRIWTDYNVHDPGITTLELLAYALTDLSYRANFPVKDLLASESDNAAEMQKQFFTARSILPNRPLTLLDYRKLIIDLPGIKNAWLQNATLTYYADVPNRTLITSGTPSRTVREVNIRGLYDVIVEYTDDVTDQPAVLDTVKARLNANRNLCEDFVSLTEVHAQWFSLCAEIDLATDADAEKVKAEIFFQVQQYLAPPVINYTLAEMLSRKKADGSSYTTDEIFDGPALDCGFIDDEELTAAELRTEIRLSDVISIIMDIEGVEAVIDIVINPKDTKVALANKWVVAVKPSNKALLYKKSDGSFDTGNSRLVFYKGEMPVTATDTKFVEKLAALETAARTKAETPVPYDFPIPLGQYRSPDDYYSFQNDFPALYGVSEYGLSSAADDARKALAYQLKGYLLFFDQLLANYFAQLSHVKELFSTDPAVIQTYYCQLVDSFADYAELYSPADPVPTIEGIIETTDIADKRRNRFLDHLIARFAEQFTDFANILYSVFGASMSKSIIEYKCAFLQEYPVISSERSLACNYTLTDQLWDTTNVSGLEKRLAKLLGLDDYRRRNLSAITKDEGMYLIEMILLRPKETTDPFVPICADPNCTVCVEDDPYSYRIHIILPAYGDRFKNMDFRRYAEEVIRAETPAHILPRICWISSNDMAMLETAFKAWLEAPTGNLQALIDALLKVRNVYPTQDLRDCTSAEPKFLLDQSALGRLEKAGATDKVKALSAPRRKRTREARAKRSRPSKETDAKRKIKALSAPRRKPTREAKSKSSQPSKGADGKSKVKALSAVQRKRTKKAKRKKRSANKR